MDWRASRSSFPRTPQRFWAASLLLFALLVYLGIHWIPPKRENVPEPKTFDVQAQILPVQFVEAGPLDLNRATVEELEKLPGIGPTLAARIVAWRETQGPFRTVEDLLAIPGIGPKTLEGLRDKVTVTPP